MSATGAAVPVLVGLATGERPGAIQVAGIVVAMAGIVLAAREPGDAAAGSAMRASLALAGLAALGFGTFFVLIDRATELGGAPWSLLLVRVGEVALLGAAALATRPAMPAGIRDASPLLIIGVLDFSATAFFALATEQGLLSVVSVVGSLYPAVTVILARDRAGRARRPLAGARGAADARGRRRDQRRLTPEQAGDLVERGRRVAAVHDVAIPSARAGLRLPGRSSTNTHAPGGSPSRSAASS